LQESLILLTASALQHVLLKVVCLLQQGFTLHPAFSGLELTAKHHAVTGLILDAVVVIVLCGGVVWVSLQKNIGTFATGLLENIVVYGILLSKILYAYQASGLILCVEEAIA